MVENDIMLFPIKVLSFSIATLSLFFVAATAPAQNDLQQLEEAAITKAVDRVGDSVIRFETVGGQARVQETVVAQSPATGVVISPDGYAVSASFHFANQPTSIFAKLPNGQRAAAEIVGRDNSRKIVLLKIQSPYKFKPASVTDLNQIKVGQTVIAVGRVLSASTPSVSTGIVSAKGRIWDKAIQTDAKVSPMNFGGPLLALDGSVAGILVPMSPDDASELAGSQWYDSGIGFAVPLSDIIARLDELKSGETLRPGLMGVSFKSDDIYADPAEVAFCQGTSPAWKSGIRPGDKIVELNGQPIERQSQLKHALGPLYANDIANVSVDRDGKRLLFELKLAAEIEPFIWPAVGATLKLANENLPTIEHVIPGGPASESGLQPGDQLVRFADEAIASNEDFRLKLAAAKTGQTVDIEISRDSKPLKKAITIGKLNSDLVDLAAAKNKNVDNDTKKASVINLQVAEAPHPYLAIVPNTATDGRPPALLVWVPEPGKPNREQLEKRWIRSAEKTGTIVLIPQSGDAKRWRKDDVDLIAQGVQTLAQQVSFDRTRVVVGGSKTGGAMASIIAFDRRELFKGLVLVDAAISRIAANIRTSPVQPMLVLACFAKQPSEPMDASIKLLESAHIPCSKQPLVGSGLGDQRSIDMILQWIQWTHRM